MKKFRDKIEIVRDTKYGDLSDLEGELNEVMQKITNHFPTKKKDEKIVIDINRYYEDTDVRYHLKSLETDEEYLIEKEKFEKKRKAGEAAAKKRKQKLSDPEYKEFLRLKEKFKEN